VRVDHEEVEEERKLRMEGKWEARGFIAAVGWDGKMKNGREEELDEGSE
jgi:hypothetical protein